MSHYTNDSCRICNSSNLKLALPLQASPLADSYINIDLLHKKQEVFDMSVFLCDECGLVQLTSVVAAEDIYIDYLYRTTTSLGLPEHFIQSAKDISKKYNLKKDSFIMDIGSNDGSLLKGYQQLGMKVLGIDPAQEIAKEATLNGIETLSIFFSKDIALELSEKYPKASIINCNNLIANIDNLNDFVLGIKNMLHENGIFICETSYLQSLIENMVFDTIYHEHLSYYGLKPLEYLFHKNGLKIVDAQIVDTKGGSLKCFIEHDKNQQVSDSILEIKDSEEKFDLYSQNTFDIFYKKINLEKSNLIKILSDLQKNNKLVYGYGASNSTTTLLYHYELNPYFKTIIDDNDIKINRYSPGFHIPIVSSEIIYKKVPDAIVIFAWRFADAIIKKHEKYLEDGGKFIIPLPKLKIIG